jgi:hypothetical protein
MKLRVNVAGYHKRTSLKDIADKEDSQNPDDIMQQFVGERYLPWIATNLPTADFIIDAYDANGFVIDFTYEDDAKVFARRVGGRPTGE